MTKIMDYSQKDLADFKSFKIHKSGERVFNWPQFCNNREKWILLGYLPFASYEDGDELVCEDIVGCSDSKSELMMQCALRGIEVK